MKTLCFMYSLTKWAWTGALIRLVWSETWRQNLWTHQKERKKLKLCVCVRAWIISSCDYYPKETDVIRDSEEIAQLLYVNVATRWWLVMGNEKQLSGSTSTVFKKNKSIPRLTGKLCFHPAPGFTTGWEGSLIYLLVFLSCGWINRWPSNQTNAEEDGW